MRLPETQAKNRSLSGETQRRKRLGQYFTGLPLGRLLAALAGASQADSIIDPMSGNGDLLQSCIDVGSNSSLLYAVDIDPLAVSKCKERIPQVTCVTGDAFHPSTLKKLPIRQWDLVITNPPYVRYQNQSSISEDGLQLSSSNETRQNLLLALEELPSLDEKDKKLFKKMVSGYSGLSDLAIPSWILCAALVKPGGRLAVVAPNSWLNRDYAAVVHYLLLRWFRIEYLVEDVHAVWFSDAQVRTNLLIARRIPRRDSAFDISKEETFLKIRMFGSAIGRNSVVENLFPEAEEPERLFAELANSWYHEKTHFSNGLVEALTVHLHTFAENIRAVCHKQRWIHGMSEVSVPPSDRDISLPLELASWLSKGIGGAYLVPLESTGVKVGQGLRTGANDFFYADVCDEEVEDGDVMLTWNNSTLKAKAKVPNGLVLPVLRRQTELPTNGFVVDAEALTARVLALQNAALIEDMESSGSLALKSYTVVPDELANVIRSASHANFGTATVPKRVTELTAVATNIRAGNEAKGIKPRFWYMLPEFAARHRPHLLVPRINNDGPRTYYNLDRRALIDANFSTIWFENGTEIDEFALLALLNSYWCRVYLELSTSVMGGGALKVEAVHLRRLPIPKLTEREHKFLSVLGRRLVTGKALEQVMEEVDELICKVLLGRNPLPEEKMELITIFDTCRQRRQKKEWGNSK